MLDDESCSFYEERSFLQTVEFDQKLFYQRLNMLNLWVGIIPPNRWFHNGSIKLKHSGLINFMFPDVSVFMVLLLGNSAWNGRLCLSSSYWFIFRWTCTKTCYTCIVVCIFLLVFTAQRAQIYNIHLSVSERCGRSRLLPNVSLSRTIFKLWILMRNFPL